MWVKVGNKKSVEIHDDVVHGVLNIYPEEKLKERPLFAGSFTNGYISYRKLLHECDSILVPWQMFFLTPAHLKKQLEHIEKQRKYKFDKKFFTKREAVGRVTSKRIIDRLIRLQSYILHNYKLSEHQFCGALNGKTKEESAKTLLEFFDIDQNTFRSKPVEKALTYLIEKIDNKGINISRGVLKGGVLPELSHAGSVYKNTSGFVVKDERIPFIFLPDDINPDEAMGRRIYTLMYLLVCIGLDKYDFYLESQFKASALKTRGTEAKRHSITTAILLPEEETKKLRGTSITETDISDLSKGFKVTPTAVVVILKKRGIISKPEYEALLPTPFAPRRGVSKSRRPGITTAVRKFCGIQAFNYVNDGIRRGAVNSIETQYLLFGRVSQKLYKDYRQKIGI